MSSYYHTLTLTTDQLPHVIDAVLSELARLDGMTPNPTINERLRQLSNVRDQLSDMVAKTRIAVDTVKEERLR